MAASVPLAEHHSPSRLVRRRDFMVDVPAKLLKRNEHLSKNATRLYLAMRALADGHTGELKRRGRWLRAEEIDTEAEMCREVRMKSMRDLIAAGLVTYKFEMVVRVIKGRRRAVRAGTQYVVYRRAQIVAKPRVLLKSVSSKVEKIDRQYISRRPSVGLTRLAAGFEVELPTGGKRAKSSPTPRAKSTRRADDGPLLPCFEDFQRQFPTVTPRQFSFASERILSRAKTEPCSRRYWQTSLENFFANLAGETELFLRDLVLLAGPDADLAEVAGRLKDEACDRDLDWNNDILDRAIDQARSRFERDAAVRSELQRG
jgi:hypothetical protein